LEAFLKDPKAYMDSLPECQLCKWEAEFGDKAMGKDKGFYNSTSGYVVNALQDGKIKIWEINQRSVLKGLSDFEKNEEYADLMPNGLIDRAVIVEKKEEKGKTSYSIGIGMKPEDGILSDEDKARYLAECFTPDQLLNTPDITTDEGKEFFEEGWNKAGPPKKGDKPKKANGK